MARAAGQIDVAKNEAILDAALQALVTGGQGVSVGEIARLAGVSKQTVYNHYGRKEDLLRAVIQRRVLEITAPLRAAGAAEPPAEALARFARVWLEGATSERAAAILRTAARTGVGASLFESGPLASRREVAAYLELETAAGRLNAPDPLLAAEFFLGMVAGSRQLSALLGASQPPGPDELDHIAREAAERFVRAYRP